mgnify:FL=1
MQESMLKKCKKSDVADKVSLIIALIVLVILFSVLNTNYFTSRNLMNILMACSLMGFVAIAETYLIIANQIDLSAGSVAAFSSVFAAYLVKMGVSPIIAMIITVLAGCIIGVINAATINYLKLQPFIATLATMSVFRGLAYILCDGKAIGISNASYNKIGSYRIFGVLPIPVLILIIAFIVFGFVLARTYFGRSIYVLGGNSYAAKLAGLNPKAIIFKLYIISGAMSALAGALLAARMNSGQPAAADGLEFDAVTAAVLGGAAFTGGTGTIFGTLLGMLILQGFNTGLLMLGVQTFWQEVAKGVLLVVALTFDYFRKLSRTKKELEESKLNKSNLVDQA